MELIAEKSAFRALCESRRRQAGTIGLVPTMGALHEGHLSLVRFARAANDFIVLSVFVNPLQFQEDADLSAYPRDLESDVKAAEAEGVDAVFAPSVEEMYPLGEPAVTVRPGRLAEILEGRARPGHFEGVATVVAKLFSLAGACRAYFGEKDYQQLLVVRGLVADLELPVEVVGCPVVREPDGLALSSRNRRLSERERKAATALSRALVAGRRSVERQVRDPEEVERAMRAVLEDERLVEPDYASVGDPATLERPVEIAAPVRLLVAARVGPVRLIDNMAAASSARGAPLIS